VEIQQAIDRLRSRTHVPLFAVETWDRELDAALRRMEPQELFADRQIHDPSAAAATIAGLHIWNDSFSASHNLCQGINNVTGAYWHAICHRREGHAGEGLQSNLANARHWFRQAQGHPVEEQVYEMALRVLDASGAGSGFRWATEAADQLRTRRRWDPTALVDWFAQADDGTLSPQSQAVLEEIQWREIDLLVDWCVQRALGG